ncbi:MAG: hypothetical protein ACYS0H_16115 [Planctomycetota bacterium]|jgi:hypothetical protein
MVPQFYRFVVVNNSGQLLTYNNNGRINLKVTAWYIAPATGLVTYAQLADDDLGFVAASTLANGAEIVGDNEIDNTSNKYIGLQVQLEITHDEGAAVTAGGFDVYIAGGDASGDLPTDADGYGSAEINKLRPVGHMIIDPASADDEVTRSQVWSV